MRFAAPLLACLLLLSCVGEQQFVATQSAAPGEQPEMELPGYVRATPAFRLELRKNATDRLINRVQRIDGVVVAAPMAIDRLPVRFGGIERHLRVVAVEPFAFRSVAPPSTRAADFVWTSLLGGRAVLTSETAESLGFGGAGAVAVGKNEFEVGALADNGVPNFGDVMVADSARASRATSRDGVVVGTKRGADLDRIRTRLQRRFPEVTRIRRLQPSSDREAPVETPDQVGNASGPLIGSMNFRILKDGFIDPDPNWVAGNIAQGTVPILGTVTCHRLMFPQLVAALSEIENAGLANRINVRDFGGCYVPRFIARNPRRGLSMHAFGLALDLNVQSNLYGSGGEMHPDIVAIFEKWGFEWGGRWSTPDPMHFELDRLIEV